MVRKFVEALRLWCTNLLLIVPVVLTVWLPGNLFGEYLLWYVPSDDDFLRTYQVANFIEGVFGPIYSGALVYALAQIKKGRRPGYSEAISVGFRNWGRLFSARFFAGIWVVLGLLLLVFPGIVLMVRFALIDAVVVLEGTGGDYARRRSTELTRGFRWQIFLVGLVFFAAFTEIEFFIRVPYQEFFPALDTMATDVAVDCVLDVVYTILQIVFFLYYWQAAEAPREERDPGLVLPEATDDL
jgi:hypothetical protein